MILNDEIDEAREYSYKLLQRLKHITCATGYYQGCISLFKHLLYDV